MTSFAAAMDCDYDDGSVVNEKGVKSCGPDMPLLNVYNKAVRGLSRDKLRSMLDSVVAVSDTSRAAASPLLASQISMLLKLR